MAKNMDVQLKALAVPLMEVAAGLGTGQSYAQNGRTFAEVIVNGPEGLATLMFDLTEAEDKAVQDIVRRAAERYVLSLKTR